MKKKNSLLKLLVPFLLAGGVITGIYSIAANKVRLEPSELKSKLISLKTVQAGNGFEDLKPLKEILKDKRIIAMGDATYGTKESIQMKHRMFEFLVEEMNYRVLAIEADFGAVQEANEYILNGTGNATDAFKDVNWNEWYTQDIADLVEWMRKYNENPNHKTKVKLYGLGFEMPYEDKKVVLSYLEKVDERVFKEFEDKLRNIIVSMDLANDKENITSLKEVFNKNKNNYIKKTSMDEFEIASQCLEVVTQSIESSIKYNMSDVIGSQKAEDNYMANNVKWILDYESKFGNDKIALWAHNSKINKSNGQFTSMGEHLINSFGDKYYSIAFDFYKGTVMVNTMESTERELTKVTLEKSKVDSFSAILEKTEFPLSFIDFKSAARDKNIKKWLSVAQRIHSFKIYNGIEEQLYGHEIPMESYDGLIFIKETSVSKVIK